MAKTKFYSHWRSMFDRTSPNYVDASAYVGITVSKRWSKFENFYKDMYDNFKIHELKHGGRNTTLERIDVYKGYNKNNCTWATQKEQSRNKKNTVRIMYNNELVPLITLCERFQKKYNAVYYKIKKGKTIENALL